MTDWHNRQAPGIKSHQVNNSYDGARNSRVRRQIRQDTGNADTSTQYDAMPLAQKARYLEANFDVVTGGFDLLVASIVGVKIRTAPLVKKKNGKPAAKFNKKLKKLYDEFMRCPDIAGRFSGAQQQRLGVRSLFRDGECFVKFYEGYEYPHHTRIPLSMELIEREQLPMHFNDADRNIIQGIEKNEYGAVLKYHFLKYHPGNLQRISAEMVEVPAMNILHLCHVKRIGQTRGVSILHAAINRCLDIQEIEEYERIGAKQGSSVGLVIEKTADYVPVSKRSRDEQSERPEIVRFYPCMVLDNLAVGEKAAMLNPNGRPNPNLEPFLKYNFRALAAAFGVSASSLMKLFDGSYSAERQQLVEQMRQIMPKCDDFESDYLLPVYKRVVQSILLYGLLTIPKNIDRDTLFDVTHSFPQMPWISPKDEATAATLLVQGGFDSLANQTRQMGRDPSDVEHEIITERERAAKAGIQFTTTTNGIQTGAAPVNPKNKKSKTPKPKGNE